MKSKTNEDERRQEEIPSSLRSQVDFPLLFLVSHTFTKKCPSMFFILSGLLVCSIIIDRTAFLMETACSSVVHEEGLANFLLYIFKTQNTSRFKL